MTEEQRREYAEACRMMDYAVRDHETAAHGYGELTKAWRRVQASTKPVYEAAHAADANRQDEATRVLEEVRRVILRGDWR